MKAQKIISFYPELSRKLGSVNAALYYQQLYYWSRKTKRKDGFVYKSAKEMERETTLTPMQQRLARKALEEKGWLEVRKMKANGAPTLHFKPLIDIKIELVKIQQMDLLSATNGFVVSNKSITGEYNSREYIRDFLPDDYSLEKSNGVAPLEPLSTELVNPWDEVPDYPNFLTCPEADIPKNKAELDEFLVKWCSVNAEPGRSKGLYPLTFAEAWELGRDLKIDFKDLTETHARLIESINDGNKYNITSVASTLRAWLSRGLQEKKLTRLDEIQMMDYEPLEHRYRRRFITQLRNRRLAEGRKV